MNMTCNIVRDLAQLYESGKASQDTEKAVNKHLDGCVSCRRYYNKRHEIRKPNFRLETCGAEEELIARNLRLLSKRLERRQTVRNICAAVTAVFGLSALLFDLINDYNKKNK